MQASGSPAWPALRPVSPPGGGGFGFSRDSPDAGFRRRPCSVPARDEQRVVAGAAEVTVQTEPSCSPWVGLSELSMSRIMLSGGLRSCTRSIQAPDRSVMASRLASSPATRSRGGPSGCSKRPHDRDPHGRRSPAWLDRGRAARRRSRPRSRRAARTPIAETARPACGARSGGRNRPAKAPLSLHPSDTPRSHPVSRPNPLIRLAKWSDGVIKLSTHPGNPG